MYLIQLLLPLRDNEGHSFPAAQYRRVAAELTERFGGLTAYTRSPAQGLWKEDEAATVTPDDIVIYEVMAGEIAHAWWTAYKRRLEAELKQERLIIRAQSVTLL